MFKATLAVKKTTEGTFVFGQMVDPDSIEVAVVRNLYIDKRDLAGLGFSKETPRLEVTIKAVS